MSLHMCRSAKHKKKTTWYMKNLKQMHTHICTHSCSSFHPLTVFFAIAYLFVFVVYYCQSRLAIDCPTFIIVSHTDTAESEIEEEEEAVDNVHFIGVV